jgi:hypothetical protein
MPQVEVSSPFRRPRFSALPPRDTAVGQEQAITSLLDLVEFNAEHNADSVFCIQSQVSTEDEFSSLGFDGCPITFKQLDDAVQNCADHLEKLLEVDRAAKPTPVALCMESDVGLFLHLAALQALDLPACSQTSSGLI